MSVSQSCWSVFGTRKVCFTVPQQFNKLQITYNRLLYKSLKEIRVIISKWYSVRWYIPFNMLMSNCNKPLIKGDMQIIRETLVMAGCKLPFCVRMQFFNNEYVIWQLQLSNDGMPEYFVFIDDCRRIYIKLEASWYCLSISSRSIGECAVPGLNATFSFFWFTNCVLLFDKNLILGCLWLLVFVLNNILMLGIWCSTIPHLPGCFCPWTFFENIGFNTVLTDPFMSHLATQLGYSAGEFQALQPIVLAAFGVVD